MTPAEHIRQGVCLKAIMTTVCPACWRVLRTDSRVWSHCGADITQLGKRDLRDELLGALSHPDRDTAIRAAVALAACHDVAASEAIETAMRRFPREPSVLAGLLDALVFVADYHAQRIALEALGHQSFIVRRAAAQVLEHTGQRDSEPACERRER